MAAELRYPGATVYCFETGRSAEVLTQAAGGQHYRLSADAELAFAPLGELSSADDIAWATGWVESCLALNGVALIPAQRNEISQQLASLARHGERTLTHLRDLIQDADIKEALKPYCLPQPLGALLDAEQDGLHMGRLMTFELEDLVQEGERFVVPVLLYLFRRIEKSLQGQPAFIHLDEAWQWLSHPTFRERIRRWLKEMRKRNCAVILLTQSLSDLDRSGILDVIVESTATKVFLPNHFARDPDTSALYRRLGLNEAQIDLLATAIPKRDYYATSKQGKRLFQLGLGPLALAFCGASDRSKVLQAEALQRQYGSAWVAEWLRLHHLNLEDVTHERI
jgi:type IV secretion system protein VirB4